MNQHNYYDILQVSPHADAEIIQAAYKRLALKYHPDRNQEPSAQDMMRLLNEAYETLSNPVRRKAYDDKRAAMEALEKLVPYINDLLNRGESPESVMQKLMAMGSDLETATALVNDVIFVRTKQAAERFQEKSHAKENAGPPSDFVEKVGSVIGWVIGILILVGMVWFSVHDWNKQQAKNYYRQGLDAFSKEDNNLAITCFSRAITADPKFADAYKSRGLNYLCLNKKDLAISDFNNAIRLNPSDDAAYFGRGNIQRQNKNYELAFVDINKAIQLNPHFSNSYCERGLIYGVKGNYDAAISDFTEAIRLKPNYALAFAGRGAAYQSKGWYEQATADWETALRLDPKLQKK